MPLATLDKGQEKTTLVFDTWARVDQGVMRIVWDLQLEPAERELLAALTASLGYLGRAESWVVATLIPEEDVFESGEAWCVPSVEGERRGMGWEQVPLLAALPEPKFESWRCTETEAELGRIDAEVKGRKQEEARARVLLPYPDDLLDCLQRDTGWLRGHGWSQPPGSRRVLYWRPTGALTVGVPLALEPRIAPPIEAMLLALSSPSRSTGLLPSVTRTLPQAELMHRALVGKAGRVAGHVPALCGRDGLRRPLMEQHAHAHILPLDLDKDGHLDHVLIWAPGGLDAKAQGAVRALRRTWTKGMSDDLQVEVVAQGKRADLERLAGVWGESLCQVTCSVGGRSWISATPFVAPRYLKKGGNDLAGQVARELRLRGLPEPIRVDLLAPGTSAEVLRLRHFVRRRSRGPQPPIDAGFALRLIFAEPVAGPLALGYGSHFGLGLFRSTDGE